MNTFGQYGSGKSTWLRNQAALHEARGERVQVLGPSMFEAFAIPTPEYYEGLCERLNYLTDVRRAAIAARSALCTEFDAGDTFSRPSFDYVAVLQDEERRVLDTMVAAKAAVIAAELGHRG